MCSKITHKIILLCTGVTSEHPQMGWEQNPQWDKYSSINLFFLKFVIEFCQFLKDQPLIKI